MIRSPSRFAPVAVTLAAALFAAVGVVAGVASKALGGGSDSEDRSHRERAGGGRTSLRGGPTVTVNVDGSIIGTDPNELARSISELITRNQRDGAP